MTLHNKKRKKNRLLNVFLILKIQQMKTRLFTREKKHSHDQIKTNATASLIDRASGYALLVQNCIT